MKKSIFLLSVALGLLTACDPIKDEATLDIDNVSSEQLLQGATFEQFSGVKNEDGSMTYTPAADGNYIKYNIPAVSSVQIYYIKSDGSQAILSTGSSGGMFAFIPPRGAEPNQTVYFRYVNQNGEEVTTTKEFTLAVASDLAPEMKLLCSNSGTKVWKWNTNAPGGQVWGNMGGSQGASDGKNLALNGDGKWWGVTSEEEFMGQLNHTNDGQAHGDESMDATMVFSEDGTVTCYDAAGKQIRQGKFSVTEYDPEYQKSTHKCGILHVDAGSILFPYEINSGGRMPTDFEIAYMSASRLVLTYPDNGDWTSTPGSEGTFWQFSSADDLGGVLSGDYTSATWTWDDESGVCWGNNGYSGFVYGGVSSLTGQWWGISSTDLAEQVESYGYGFADVNGATMTFNADGTFTKSTGGTGTFSFDGKNTVDLGGYDEGKTWGRFTTTGDGILFPVSINKGVVKNEFDVVYFDDDHLVLAHPNYPKGSKADDGSDAASWMECTMWRFKKVK